jgi:glycosyltransferase involved in cell wall biosynthesis
VDGENGFLVPRSNPEVLAQKVELLLDDSELAQRMGRAGKLHLQRHFSLDQLVVNTMRMYQEVLAGRDNRASGKGTCGSRIEHFVAENRDN